MSVELDARPIFAAHQTFHPRFGWLKKAFDAVNRDSKVFTSPNAMVVLGVGKNMVDAIRFWGNAFRVIEPQDPASKKTSRNYQVTKIGKLIFDDSIGLDPFVENPSTLWLLHWYALTAPSELPVWRLLFNDFSGVEFNIEDFANFVDEQISGTSWRIPVQASLEKDIDCLIRMYSTRSLRGRQTIDDIMDSPFRNLNLINPTPSDELTFRISIGEKPYLNEFLVLYTCLDFMILNDPGTKSATTTRLARDPGSPGRLLKLSEEDLLSYLEKSTFEVEGVTIASPAGSSQLIVEGSHHDLARKVLMKIYNRQINKSISDFVGSVMRSGLNQLTLDIPGRASCAI